MADHRQDQFLHGNVERPISWKGSHLITAFCEQQVSENNRRPLISIRESMVCCHGVAPGEGWKSQRARRFEELWHER
jgi:hypothetical protein